MSTITREWSAMQNAECSPFVDILLSGKPRWARGAVLSWASYHKAALEASPACLHTFINKKTASQLVWPSF
eukprot:744898-Pelagomonas_calceolata.AAC.4